MKPALFILILATMWLAAFGTLPGRAVDAAHLAAPGVFLSQR